MQIKPLISIVVPCHNQAHYLDECLKSIIRQTVEDWEAIVVDDASTIGNVAAVVEGFHDRRITYIQHSTNRGLAAARNTGTRHASAQIIVPLDADDFLHHTYLEVVLKFLSKREYGFVYFDVQCFGESTNRWRSKKFDAATFVTAHQFILGATPHLKEVWEKCGGWCEEDIFRRGYEDGDFWLSVIRHGYVGKYVDDPLYYYRKSSSSMAAQPRVFVLPIYHHMYMRNKDLIDKYSSYEEWMTLGWLEVANGYLKFEKPLKAFGCCLRALLITKYKRKEVLIVINSSLVMIRHKSINILKDLYRGLWNRNFWRI